MNEIINTHYAHLDFLVHPQSTGFLSPDSLLVLCSPPLRFPPWIRCVFKILVLISSHLVCRVLSTYNVTKHEKIEFYFYLPIGFHTISCITRNILVDPCDCLNHSTFDCQRFPASTFVIRMASHPSAVISQHSTTNVPGLEPLLFSPT